MIKLRLKEKVIELRKQGKTYSEIKNSLRKIIPESTLSYWCKGVSLPPKYYKKIKILNEINREKGRKIALERNKRNRERYLSEIKKRNLVLFKKIDLKAMKLALSMLYLGEGAKWKSHSGLLLGSSNSIVILLYISLLKKCYKIKPSQLKCRISYRADQNIRELEKYWSGVTGIPQENFYKTKPDPRTKGKKTKKNDYKGVCVVTCAGSHIQLELEEIAKILLKKLRACSLEEKRVRGTHKIAGSSPAGSTPLEMEQTKFSAWWDVDMKSTEVIKNRVRAISNGVHHNSSCSGNFVFERIDYLNIMVEKFLKEIVKQAGRKLLFYFKKENALIGLRGTSKEIVTKYDKMIDRFLVRAIQRKFPSHSILSEESGLIEKDKNYLWIIDSLDGSGNFANKNPLFSLCVAFYCQKEPQLSVIFAPALDEFYFAKKSKGAFLNKKKIKVSKIGNLKESYLVHCEGNEKNKKRIAKIFSHLYPKVKDLRKIGSAGIETAWVAAGRVDGYLTTKIDPWDVAAGVLLVKEAGGKISNFKGEKWRLKGDDMIFSNGFLHEKIQQIVNEQ